MTRRSAERRIAAISILHSFRCAYTQQRKPVRERLTYRCNECEPRMFDVLIIDQKRNGIVVTVEGGAELAQIKSDVVRGQVARCRRQRLWKFRDPARQRRFLFMGEQR